MAVKVINQPVTDDPQYLEALQREARLAAGLDHPNVTTVYDFQVEGDNAYIVMEYVPDALDRHLQGGSHLPWQRATEIAVLDYRKGSREPSFLDKLRDLVGAGAL